MKKIAFYASIMVLCLGIVACNGKKNNEQEEQPAEQHECCCHHHEMSEEECAAMKAMMEQWANFDNLTEEAQVALLAQRKEMMDKMMKPCCKQGEEGCCKGEKTCCKGENAEGEHTCCKGENAEGEH
ncbi:MAG: hypothetical protein Q4D14_07335, partial [Bacteroidales bacterium]|nr:hypothetical protein [Bacteroidales bacterium]